MSAKNRKLNDRLLKRLQWIFSLMDWDITFCRSDRHSRKRGEVVYYNPHKTARITLYPETISTSKDDGWGPDDEIRVTCHELAHIFNASLLSHIPHRYRNQTWFKDYEEALAESIGKLVYRAVGYERNRLHE